jgi:hypothetical protein
VKLEVLLLCAQDLASGPYPISLFLIVILSFHLNKVSQEVYSLEALLLIVAFYISLMHAECPHIMSSLIYLLSIFQEVKIVEVRYI